MLAPFAINFANHRSSFGGHNFFDPPLSEEFMANLKIFLAAVMLFVNTLWMDEFALAGNPSCPANSLNGKGCSTVTSSSTCPTYYMPGSNGSSSVACKWNGSSCSDGGGDCSVNGTPPPPPTCPVNSLNGSGCSTVTDSNTCSSYYMPGSNGSSSVACSWNGSSCSDGGGDCTGGSSPPPPPKACPSTSLNGSGCSTITDGSTCPSYYMPGSNGSSSIACSWNGSSCSDGGGDCTPPGAEPEQPSDVGAAPTTSCEGASSGWPLFNNGSNEFGEAQICGNGYASGNLSIGGDKTHSWTNYAPSGSGAGGPGQWVWYDGCYYVNDSNITVTTTGNMTINPWSATATNWLMPVPGNSETRYWSSGALWGTGVQVNPEGTGDWYWAGSQGQSSGEYSAELPMWTHGCSSTGTMQMHNYVQANVNSTANNAAISMALPLAKFPRVAQSQIPPSNAIKVTAAPSLSKQKGNFRIVEKQVALPFDYTGGNISGLKAECPSGFILMQSSVLSLGAVDTARISSIPSGILVSGTSAMAGTTVKSQVVCLKTGLGKILRGGNYWGTKGSDKMENVGTGLFYFGGPGRDRISASGDASQVFGGPGNDNLLVSGKDSVGVGGPGDDQLTAVGDFRIRLEGGEGRDRLRGDIGISILDVRDGQAGDHVTCVGTKNIALVDEGDNVMGTCAQVVRGTY